MFAWTLFLLLLSAWGTCSEIHDPQEVHLKNVRQLTFGGRNLRPSVSTDGKYLLFTSQLLPDATIQALLCRQLYVLDLEQPDAPRQHVSSLYGTFESAAFFPHEHRLVTASDYLTIRESRHEVLSMWQKCFLNHGNLGELQSNLEGHNYDLLVTDLNHARPIDLTATRDFSNVEVAVSPKGDLVAFVRVDGRGKRSLWTVRVDGGNETKLVGEMQFVSSPVFSPDGWEIVFHGVDGLHEEVPPVRSRSSAGPDGELRAELPLEEILECFTVDGEWAIVDVEKWQALYERVEAAEVASRAKAG
ncbi:WD40-like beta Propeller containing protein [Aphelenchoides fujianensis]|nr:WD40-like beta Propeller containing protein [Aphelenchoides fujianensis]